MKFLTKKTLKVMSNGVVTILSISSITKKKYLSFFYEKDYNNLNLKNEIPNRIYNETVQYRKKYFN